jgi:NADH:ubiquinone oxidoreductase subunit F (NADH-binding)
LSGVALLGGPSIGEGRESGAAHTRRLGPLPPTGRDFISTLEASRLHGRGGGAFPVATKWRSLAAQPQGHPTVLVNGGEGEPLSRKDRLLMETRPHLVLDGAEVAARVLDAGEVVLYIGADHTASVQAMRQALAERSADEQRRTRTVSAPVRYVSGEESAAVHFVNDGVALPTTIPPRPFEAGVGGRPTLVQNVETLAHIALIARFGGEWHRGLGRRPAAGTALITVNGAVPSTTVIEVAQGTTIAEAVDIAGGLIGEARAVLLGGYFGTWLNAADAWGVPLDDVILKAHGLSLGCGVIGVLPHDACGVVTSSRVLSYLGHESARQCGPCTFGLRAIAAATARIASMAASMDDLLHIQRWAGMLPGRGACHHPDGAAGFLQSALRVFTEEFELHTAQRSCSVSATLAVPA